MRLLNLPGAPALLARVGGRTDPAAELRATCTAAVTELLTDSIDRVIIIAAGARTADWSPNLGYPIERLIGGRASGTEALPLPLAVGRELIGDRAAGRELILQTVARTSDLDPDSASDADLITPADAPATERPDDDTLIVAVADGSALGRVGGGPGVEQQ